MFGKFYKNSYKLIGNPAKNLVKEARKMIAESNREFGFERVALDLAAAEKVSATQIKLTEIAEWHQHCAIEKLATAVSYLRRAERCALTIKYRHYAAIRLKKYEDELKRFEGFEAAVSKNDADKSAGIKTFLRNISTNAAYIFSLF